MPFFMVAQKSFESVLRITAYSASPEAVFVVSPAAEVSPATVVALLSPLEQAARIKVKATASARRTLMSFFEFFFMI